MISSHLYTERGGIIKRPRFLTVWENWLKVKDFGGSALSIVETRHQSTKLELLDLKWEVYNQFRNYVLYELKIDMYMKNNSLLDVLSTAKLMS